MKKSSTDFRNITAVKEKIVYPGISLIFWIFVWLFASHRAHSSLLLPGPFETAKEIIALFFETSFYKICLYSFLRVISGMLAGIFTAVILAVLCSFSSLVKHMVFPFARIVKTTPVASFIILAMLWLGHGILPSVIAALMVFPTVFQNMLTSIEEIPYEHKRLIKIFKPDFKTKLTKIYIPDVLPYFFASVKVSMGLSWKAGIAAEVLAYSPVSIGRQLTESKNMLETGKLFAWTAAVIIISLLMEAIVGFVFRKATPVQAAPKRKHHETT